MQFKKLSLMMYLCIQFILLGCGGSSSSNTQSEDEASSEQVAIYIPPEELEKQKILSKATKSTTLLPNNYSKVIKEDRNQAYYIKGNEWIVYDKSPAGANINVVYDDISKSKVIELDGDGLNNGYVLGYWTKSGSWNDNNHTIIQWSMKYNEDYYVYVRISTAKGYRYLYYTPSDGNYGIAESYDAPHYIHHGLGKNSIDGTWKTFSRDLEADLKDFDPDNTLISIDGFFVRGSGQIGTITLFHKAEEPSKIRTAIDAWLSNQGVVRLKGRFLFISKDKTRAVITAFKRTPKGSTNYKTYTRYILDISNLEHILSLMKRPWSRFALLDVKIKDNDYILLAEFNHLLIYDYKTGVLLSQETLNRGTDYLVIKENYAIVQQIISSEHILKKIDFTNRRNLVVTQLYSNTSQARYSLSSDGLSILVFNFRDNWVERQLIEEIFIEDKEIRTKIEQWLHDNGLIGTTTKISADKTRIIANAHTINTSLPDVTLLLDGSDLNNIQELARINVNRYNKGEKDVIKKNDYILILGKQVVLLYDYKTGHLLSKTALVEPPSSIEYFLVRENKIIYRDKASNGLKVINFTDRVHPSIRTLFEGDVFRYLIPTPEGYAIAVVFEDGVHGEWTEEIESLYFEKMMLNKQTP